MKHLILALVLILPLSVGAFDPEHLKLLKETGDCLRCDLSRANLMEANLIGANLKNANLGYAIMVGVILCNTTMPDGRVEYSGC